MFTKVWAKKTRASVVIAFVLLIVLSQVVFAGTNGQQLKIYYHNEKDCPVQVVVRGYNQNNQYAVWSRTVYCSDRYTTTNGWWWKSKVLVEVTYRRRDGSRYTIGKFVWVPTQQRGDWFTICMLYCR